MSQTDHSAVGMSLGEQLRRQRLELGLSVAQAATAISALPKWVECIETNADLGLPAAHAQSVLRRYASLLSVPLQPTEIEESTELPTMRSLVTLRKDRRSVRRWPRLVGSLAIVVSLMGFSFVSGAPERALSSLMHSQWTAAKDTEATVTEVRQIQARQLPARSLNASPGNESKQVITELSDQSVAEFDLGAEPVLGQQLSVRLRKDTWLELTDANGQSLVDDLLRAASEHTFLGQPPFEMLVGVGSAIELSLDDTPIDHLSVAEQGHSAGLTRILIHPNGEVEVRQ